MLLSPGMSLSFGFEEHVPCVRYSREESSSERKANHGKRREYCTRVLSKAVLNRDPWHGSVTVYATPGAGTVNF